MEVPLTMNTDDIPQQIVDRFPYMFSGANIGLSMMAGWRQPFETLCQEIDAELGDEKRGFHWSQLKEKLGTARWHWAMGPHQNRPDVITKMVNQAMAKPPQLRCVCGEPGQLNQEADWMLTLCPLHTQENHHQEKMDRLSRIKAPKGAGELLLYLDFDGVLHHEDVCWHPKKGPCIEAERYTLFQHTPLLEQLLTPYPAVRIVLSTRWVQIYSCTKAAKRLPPSLRERVIGATFHSQMDRYAFSRKPRGMQIWEDVVCRRPGDWLALEDDYLRLPKWCMDKYVKTNPHDGISDPVVFAEIERKLADMAASIDMRGLLC